MTVALMLIKGIQGQLNTFSNNGSIPRGFIPWNKKRENMPQNTPTMTVLGSILPAKNARINIPSKGPVKSPVKKSALFNSEPC